MSNFWSDSVSDQSVISAGSTPFGIYDTDSDYQTDGPKVQWFHLLFRDWDTLL